MSVSRAMSDTLIVLISTASVHSSTTQETVPETWTNVLYLKSQTCPVKSNKVYTT